MLKPRALRHLLIGAALVVNLAVPYLMMSAGLYPYTAINRALPGDPSNVDVKDLWPDRHGAASERERGGRSGSKPRGARRGSGRGGAQLGMLRNGDDDFVDELAILRATHGSLPHVNRRPNLHRRCADPGRAVHVVFPVTRRHFAGAVASMFSILRHASEPESIYFHFVVPAGINTDPLCSRVRLYARTYPESFCSSRAHHGGLQRWLEGWSDAADAKPKPSKQVLPSEARGHAANESLAWAAIHGGGKRGPLPKWGKQRSQEGEWADPGPDEEERGEEQGADEDEHDEQGGGRRLQQFLGQLQANLKGQAESRLKLARAAAGQKPSASAGAGRGVDLARRAASGPARGAGQEQRQRLSQLTQSLEQLQREAMKGKASLVADSRKGAKAARRAAPGPPLLARADLQQTALMQQPRPRRRPLGPRVAVPQCRGRDDERQRKRAQDRAAEAAETERRVAELEAKLELCEIVPGLQSYTFHNSTDCQRPESIRALVRPVRLSGWEKEDALDALFEDSNRPCSCGIPQADVLRFNLSHWAEPGDIIDVPNKASDSMTLASYAPVYMDDLFLPWNVDAAVVLHPDTVVQGDIGSLWNSSEVTRRSLKRRIRKEQGSGQPDYGSQQQAAAVIVRAGELTELQDSEADGAAQGPVRGAPTVIAAVDDCTTPQSQVYNFASFTVSRLAHHQQCSILPGMFLMDIQAYSDNRLQSKVVDLLLRNQAGDKIWREKDGRGDKAFFLALSHHQARSIDSSWNVAGLGSHAGMKAAQLKGANLLHWSGPRKPWMAVAFYQGKWAQYYLHWEPPLRPARTSLHPAGHAPDMAAQQKEGWVAYLLRWLAGIMAKAPGRGGTEPLVEALDDAGIMTEE